MWSWKRHFCGWLIVAGILSVGAGTASATSGLRLTITPGTVHPGGMVRLGLRAPERSCRLSILDAGRVIYRVTIRRGITALPFSANSAGAQLVIKVRCGRRTITRRLSVLAPSPGRGAPHPPAGATAPPVTTGPPPASSAAPATGPPPASGAPTGPAPGTPAATPPAPTAAETAAVAWASRWLHRSAPSGMSVAFAYLAYDAGAGIDLRRLTPGVTYTLGTDAQNVWGHTAAGTTGAGTPPFGALVFFAPTRRSSSGQDGRVALMGAGGEMIATPDSVDPQSIHEETLAQAQAAGSPSAYLGWWLPDGKL